MENINNNDNNILELNFGNVEVIEKDNEINLDWQNLDDDKEEDYIYEIKILFIGNSLSGKSFIITKLIENYNNENAKIKINSNAYKRTLGLDKRFHQININEENFIIKYFEIASNLEFDRLNDDYIEFLNCFDLIFFILNKEINFEENILYLEIFKNSIKDSKLTNELNAKYFFEEKFYIVNSTLNYDDNDILKLMKISKNNKMQMRKETKASRPDFLNYQDHLFFEINNDDENLVHKKTLKITNVIPNNIAKNEEKNKRFSLKEIKFNINNFSEFKRIFSNMIYSLFYKNDTIKCTSRKSNGEFKNENFVKNLTIVKNQNKDLFDLASRFFFEKQRKKIKKKIYC